MTEPDFLAETRTSYDTIAADYAERTRDDLPSKPLDRAMLDVFAQLVREAGLGPVADLGCGPGTAAVYLHERGVDVFGIDLSPRMVALARQTHPDLRFEVGSMTALDLPDGSLGGVVAWYSIIHMPPEELPGVFAEFHRVLAPGGHALLAFQVGEEPQRRTEWFGHAVTLSLTRPTPERAVELLGQAGLVTQARLLREPADDGLEKLPRVCLLTHKPDQSGEPAEPIEPAAPTGPAADGSPR